MKSVRHLMTVFRNEYISQSIKVKDFVSLSLLSISTKQKKYEIQDRKRYYGRGRGACG
jgi:hypothetical protein